jgi:hypothetical protein
MKKNIDKMGIWGAGALGFFFALAFCPTSAALFFGGIISLGVKSNSALFFPIFYGIGTALPVIGFSLLLAFGAHLLGTFFKKLTVIEIWVRRITAGVMILVSVILILKHNFGVYLGF